METYTHLPSIGRKYQRSRSKSAKVRLATALTAPAYDPNNPWGPWRYYQCSYPDMFLDGGMVHMFVPFRWQRAVHLSVPETDLRNLPMKRELFG